MTVVSASLALMVGAGFAGCRIQKLLRIQTDPVTAVPFRKKPRRRMRLCRKTKHLNPGTRAGKIESSAGMKAASAPLVQMAGALSVV
jgi:hypothetical protein